MVEPVNRPDRHFRPFDRWYHFGYQNLNPFCDLFRELIQRIDLENVQMKHG